MEVCSSISAHRAPERRSWQATCRHISRPASPVRTVSMATRRKPPRDRECLLHICPPTRYDRESCTSKLSTDSPFRKECNIFREDVWGKQLLTRAGVRAISWAPLQEADTLSLSLWKEWTGPAAFSIVFRALKKRHGQHERELIELGRKLFLRCVPTRPKTTLIPFVDQWPDPKPTKSKSTSIYTSNSTRPRWQLTLLRRRKHTRN